MKKPKKSAPPAIPAALAKKAGRAGDGTPADVTLLAVTGMSPAVLTETLWALAHEPEPIIPARVIVITTTAGRRSIETGLFAPHERWNGLSPWESLRRAIAGSGRGAEERLRFGTTGQDIRVFTAFDTEAGRSVELPDLRTPADNEAAADFLLEQVRGLAENPDTRLIASIAGGRKTMGALLYACLTLVGRETDRLTHVLVNEPFETLRDFWFPGQPGGAIRDREGHLHDPAAAKIELANVPFVPLRNLFERDLVRKPGSFRGLVARCGQRVDELARNEVQLELAADRPEIRVNGRPVKLSVAEYVILFNLATAAIEKRPAFAEYKWATKSVADTAAQIYKQRADSFEWRSEAGEFKGIDERWLSKHISELRKKLRGDSATSRLIPFLPATRRFSLDLPVERIRIQRGGEEKVK